MPGYGLGAMASHQQSPVEPGLPPHFFDEPLPYLVRGCFSMEHFEFPATKRQKLVTNVANTPSMSSPSTMGRESSIQSLTSCADGATPSPQDKTTPMSVSMSAPTKSKRVRTGCLTCRERHLKCDEAAPDCMNCRKSNRECKRGVRLNFIDIQVKGPSRIHPTLEWSVQFQDESRQIASEYQGGLSRYARIGPPTITPPGEPDLELALRQQQQQPAPPQHQHRPRTDSVGRTRLVANNATGMQASANPSVYGFSNNGQQMPSDPSTFEDSNIDSRKSSEASFLTGPPSSHSGSYGLQEQFTHVKVEPSSQGSRHAYRTSDVSSTASLTPTPTNQSSSFRTPGSGLPPDGIVTPPPSDKTAAGEREYLNSPDELLYMQVFVEEVGVWMDSLDKDKHFSRLIPYHALKSPMLLNAFLACGVKHLTLVNPAYKDDKALFYYDTATTQLLRSLQNPDRNTAECATTAVVLNVYEIMSEKPQQRMNHIAGARALIRECGWDARSTGVGAACFWLNIGMEVLSCLAFNWPTAWDPDQWGVDMDFSKGRKGCGGGGDEEDGDCTGRVGGEEIWVHRIFYIVAKIANFRATIPRFQEASPHDEQARLGQRLRQWQELKRLCDSWNDSCPRTMHPFGYLYPAQTESKSAFPNVWLIKRAAIIGRLFYHTAQCLLAQTNPTEPARSSGEMQIIQLHHAHQVCGIVAHSKDRGVASVAIRSLAIASSVLTERSEQEEVLEMLNKINAETGWRLGKVTGELKRAWGWEGGRSGSLVGKVFSNNQSQGQGGARSSPSLSQGQRSLQSSPQVRHPQAPEMQSHQSHQHQQSQSQPQPQQPHPHPHPRQQQSHQQSQHQQHQRQHTPGNLPPAHPAQNQTPSSLSSVSTSGNSTPTPVIASAASAVVAPAPMKAPVNPLSFADFSLPNHPYQNWYEPPNRTGSFSQAFF